MNGAGRQIVRAVVVSQGLFVTMVLVCFVFVGRHVSIRPRVQVLRLRVASFIDLLARIAVGVALLA